ncbi:MAG: toll/interleukin-1 receptor domain-containing protein [Gammaproteobacteria bacterium]
MKAGDIPTVFLSYAHEDRPEATRLYADLTAAGLPVWFDQESLLPGQQWKPAIRTAIRNSRFFVALMSSRSSMKRGFVNREFAEAFEVLEEFAESAVFLIPVRLDDCEPAHSRLLDLHTVNLFPDWDAGVTRLLRALGAPRALSRASPPFSLTILSPSNGARVAHATRFEGTLTGTPPDVSTAVKLV